MYNKCFGIKNAEDTKKVEAFLKANNIAYDAEFGGLRLFENEEALFRLTQIYKVVDQDGKEVEVTQEMTDTVAEVMGDNEYLDYATLDGHISNELKTMGYHLEQR